MRVPFSQVFNVSGGRIVPRVPVKIGDMTMGPNLTIATGGVKVGGVDLGMLVGKYLDVHQDGQTTVIDGYFA